MIYLILSLITVPLAVWRLSDMLADGEQGGLFESLTLIRKIIGVKYDMHSNAYGKPGSIAEGSLCVACNSVWFGILFTILLICNQEVTFYVSLPFALSAVAILIARL